MASISGVMEEKQPDLGRSSKRKRSREEEDGGARKMSRCWSFASDLVRSVTVRVATAVQDVVKAACRFGDVAWGRQGTIAIEDSHGDDGEVMEYSCGHDDCGGDSETLDTADAYERALSSSTLVRNVPTFDVGVAKPVETVSRSALKQQLLQRVSMNATARQVETSNVDRNTNNVTPFVKVKSRGVKMLDLVDRDVPRSPGPLDTGALERGCSAHDDDDENDTDTRTVGEGVTEKECVDAGSAEASLSSLRGSAAQEVSLVNMVQHGSDADKSGDATSALSPQLCSIVDDIVLPEATDDVFEGFNIPDVWVPHDDNVPDVAVQLEDKSPVPRTTIGIENHSVDLSPDDAPCVENTASKASPPPVRVQSMRALLRKWGKNGGAGKQREVENALFTKLRECVLNTRLAKHYKLGEEWAKLNASGVDVDMEVDFVQLELEAVESVKQEHGDEALETYMTDIEKDWEHICAVRQRYSVDHCHDDTGKTPKSILKRDMSGRKSSPRLRWAEENIQHTYCENEYTDTHTTTKSDQVQHSTRGLRMLLASSGAKYSQSCSGGVSPPCAENSHQISSDKHILRINGRSRSRTISSVGKSQGQRLFQALQQAAPDPSTAIHQSMMNAPKTLSTAMQVSEISPNRA